MVKYCINNCGYTTKRTANLIRHHKTCKGLTRKEKQEKRRELKNNWLIDYRLGKKKKL